jgi:predicted RNase H-like HicB family nuclease
MSEIFSGDARIAVGLEQGPGGECHAHCMNLPGCVASGDSADSALDALGSELNRWLGFLAALGEPVPPPHEELEVVVEEWISTDVAVGAGESNVCFQADRPPLSEDEIQRGLAILGSIRGRILPYIRRAGNVDLEAFGSGDWNVRIVLDELARAQWWTLTRLGASPLAEVPERVVARLDTSMALTVQQFTELSQGAGTRSTILDGEEWTPRKVLRRLLWLEWALGGAALHTLTTTEREQVG